MFTRGAGTSTEPLSERLACSLGGRVRRAFGQLGSLSWLLGKCTGAWLRLNREQRRVVWEVTRTQIRFTALDALPLCCFTALLLGGITLLQVFGQLSAFGVERHISQILARLVIRELGPLMVGILVIIRSGTAMATEMASRKLSGELGALYVSGVDPIPYLLLPRLLGGTIPLVCTSYGLRVRRSLTEIPQAVTKASVISLAVLLLSGAILSVLIYA